MAYYQPHQKRGKWEVERLFFFIAKNGSCCKKQSLSGTQCYSLTRPEAEDKEGKKEPDTDTSYYSGTDIDLLWRKPMEKSINHYPGRYNGPDHFGLMFNGWEDKPGVAASSHTSQALFVGKTDLNILSHRLPFSSSKIQPASTST